MRYLVFDIGCLECGGESKPVGVFNTLDEARAAKDKYDPQEGASFWAQHEVLIYDLTTNEVVQ